MTIELENKLSFLGITGDSHTLVDDIQPLSDEKDGTAVEPSRSTSSQSTNISCDIIRKIVSDFSETGKSVQRPDSIQDYNLWELIKSWCKFPKMEKCTMVVPEPSTTANLAIDNAAGGNNRLNPSTYTPLVPKTAILRVTTRCSQILRPSTVWGGQLYPLKTRILAAAAFVNSKLSYKNGNPVENSTQGDTSNNSHHGGDSLYFSITKL